MMLYKFCLCHVVAAVVAIVAIVTVCLIGVPIKWVSRRRVRWVHVTAVVLNFAFGWRFIVKLYAIYDTFPSKYSLYAKVSQCHSNRCHWVVQLLGCTYIHTCIHIYIHTHMHRLSIVQPIIRRCRCGFWVVWFREGWRRLSWCNRLCESVLIARGGRWSLLTFQCGKLQRKILTNT